MPWLHTVAFSHSGSSGRGNSGPSTFVTMKSGRLPTPITPPTPTLLLSMSSGTEPCPPTTAPRYQTPSPTRAWGLAWT
ncbi:hypothetical protein F0U59_39910 [Archangium gephyra]|nr:hypothetical protein F0U59_39910 [Archangium gephyra]